MNYSTRDAFCKALFLVFVFLHIINAGDREMKKFLSAALGMLIGLINGTVGAGGGLVAVPLLKSGGLSTKDSHSTAVALLLPISAVSAATYLYAGHVTFSDAAPYLLPSVIGAGLGVVLMKFIPTGALKKIFAVFMLYAGVRLFLK